jgi:hypothetical protein
MASQTHISVKEAHWDATVASCVFKIIIVKKIFTEIPFAGL